MKWKKLKPVKKEDIFIGCLNCSTATDIAEMDDLIVGSGYAYLTLNGQTIIDQNFFEKKYGRHMTFADAEKIASKSPNNDWRVVRFSGLHGETFQRQRGKWICVESNKGYA